MYSQGLSNAIGPDFLFGTQKVTVDDISRIPVLMLYFTASYCPVSQRFNEFLFQTYSQINAQRKNMEIIAVPKERNEVEHRKLISRFPCLHVPYDCDRIQELYRKYSVREIPTVLLLKRDDGSILTRDGRTHMETDGVRVVERWRKQFGRLVE